MAKQIAYNENARHKILAGVNQLADTVKSPWAPKGAMWSLIKSSVPLPSPKMVLR